MTTHHQLQGAKTAAAALVFAAIAASSSGAAAQQNTVRFGFSHVEPNSSASNATGPFLLAPNSGVSLKVQNRDTAFFSFARAIGPQLEVELALGYPPTHDVVAQLDPAIVPGYIVANFQGQTIAKVRQLAPTLFLNYRFGDEGGTWRPFVGAGVNYTKFDKRESTATGNALNGGPTRIDLTDSWGLALQAGVGYRVNAQWSVNAALATARVRTTLTATTAGAARNIDIRFHPAVFTLSAGYSF